MTTTMTNEALVDTFQQGLDAQLRVRLYETDGRLRAARRAYGDDPMSVDAVAELLAATRAWHKSTDAWRGLSSEAGCREPEPEPEDLLDEPAQDYVC